MSCAALESRLEGVADGSIELADEDRDHVASCAVCAVRLQRAREIERWLAAREVPQPPASFTAAVMARVRHDQWRTERVVDLGFNLAIVAGLLVILGSAAGTAWSLGLFSIDMDIGALVRAATAQVGGGRVVPHLQTIALAAGLLTMALVLWWWAETAAD
jgi:hypothetical protein